MREASVTLMGLVDFMDPISGHMFLEQFWGWYFSILGTIHYHSHIYSQTFSLGIISFLRVPHANIGGGGP